MLKMNEYLKAKQACEFLGVSRSTLKNMDRDGTLVAHRAPSSRYRLYTMEQLETFLNSVQGRRIHFYSVEAPKMREEWNEEMDKQDKEQESLEEVYFNKV